MKIKRLLSAVLAVSAVAPLVLQLTPVISALQLSGEVVTVESEGEDDKYFNEILSKTISIPTVSMKVEDTKVNGDPHTRSISTEYYNPKGFTKLRSDFTGFVTYKGSATEDGDNLAIDIGFEGTRVFPIPYAYGDVVATLGPDNDVLSDTYGSTSEATGKTIPVRYDPGITATLSDTSQMATIEKYMSLEGLVYSPDNELQTMYKLDGSSSVYDCDVILTSPHYSWFKSSDAISVKVDKWKWNPFSERGLDGGLGVINRLKENTEVNIASTVLESYTVQILAYTPGDSTETTYLLRYYVWDSYSHDESGDFTNRENGLYFDFDITELMYNIASDSSVSESSTPILYYLKDKVANRALELAEGNAAKNGEILQQYLDRTVSPLSSTSTKTVTLMKEFISSVLSNSSTAVTVTGTDGYSADEYLVRDAFLASLIGAGLIPVDTDALGISNVYSSADTNIFAADSSYTMLKAVEAANEVAERYANKSVPYSRISLESNAALFNDLMVYRYGMISGATAKTEMGSMASDQYTNVESLNRLLVKWDDSVSGLQGLILNPYLWDQVGSLKRSSKDMTVGEFMSIMVSLQMLEQYASSAELSGIEATQDQSGTKYINSTIETAIDEATSNLDEDGNPTEEPIVIEDRDTAAIIDAYRQIHDGLDFLGIDPWTYELQAIYDYYNDIADFDIGAALPDYDAEDDTQPLKRFFDIEGTGTLSNHLMTGVALSATYVPFVTNLYDYTSVRVLEDESWLSDFHMRYGFYRKALMIDTNVNAAVEGYVTSGASASTLRVATLQDLLEPEKDIVLYVDDNYYNVDLAAEMLDKTYDRLNNTEQASTSDGEEDNGFFDLWATDINTITKTAEFYEYDETLKDVATQYGADVSFWDSLKEGFLANGSIMSDNNSNGDNEILDNLNSEIYTVKQSYAVVSAIYRHKDLCNKLNSIASNPKPVFVSSPTLYKVTGASEEDFNSVFNYAMLKNIPSVLGVDYKTTLDVDNPLYIDIYGNIITESGLVVIPAASNATLYPAKDYTTYTMGFMYLYSKGWNIPYPKFLLNENGDEDTDGYSYMDEFYHDTDKDVYVQNNIAMNDVPIMANRVSTSDEAVIKILYDNQIMLMKEHAYNFDQRVWLVTEVLRGAPLENIDKEKEGLSGKRDIGKYGLYMSWKLDEIADYLLPTTNGNSIISMPNLAFMDGIEYVVVYLFKALLVFFVLYVMYNIYIDVVGGRLGIRTLGRCISTVVVFCICIAMVPNVVSMSYNLPNKFLLQDEIRYINLLNLEKNLEGREISAVGVEEPTTNTKLYLKVDDVEIPWYSILGDIMTANAKESIDQLYQDAIEDNMLYGYEDIQVVNDGVYIDVADIFNSSSVVYNKYNQFMYQYVSSSPTASYFVPYYYLLDNMLWSINKYNKENNIINVTTKIQSDGSVKTIGMINDYLLSEYFLVDDEDPLGLKTLYGVPINEAKEFITAEDMETVSRSMWFISDYFDNETIEAKIDELYSYMRSCIARDRFIIGRVTDETYLKVLCLDLSMKYNDLFRIPAARGVEVFGIDYRDILRMSITSSEDSIINSSYSFGRAIYEDGGAIGVILTVFLTVILFIVSIVKPSLVIFLCVLLCYNVLFRGMIQDKKSRTVEGLLYTLVVMVFINSIYALTIKLSMFLPDINMNTVICLIADIVIQILYLIFVFMVVRTIFRDMGNMGFNVFHAAASVFSGALFNKITSVADKAKYDKEQRAYMDEARRNSGGGYTYYTDERGRVHRRSRMYSSDDLREEMYRRDRVREEASDEDFYTGIFDTRDNNQSQSG